MIACARSMISCSAPQLEFDDHTTRTPEIDQRDKPGDDHVKTMTRGQRMVANTDGRAKSNKLAANVRTPPIRSGMAACLIDALNFPGLRPRRHSPIL
jgi:hypothetical protein